MASQTATSAFAATIATSGFKSQKLLAEKGAPLCVLRSKRQLVRTNLGAMNFRADRLACGRKFRALTVRDLFAQEAISILVDISISGTRVADELQALVERSK